MREFTSELHAERIRVSEGRYVCRKRGGSTFFTRSERPLKSVVENMKKGKTGKKK